ncbi:hypothetical protein [Tessaracoccus defluvii]|uniref:hypothetical protein n=1 Tax=Tessaracoccus defluvii TaxID=1285901 RepID=UPI0031D58220
MSEITISRGMSTGRVQLRGAMATGSFAVGGRIVDPFYTAPWDGFPEDPLLDKLRGDFLCVPFGITPSGDLPDGWNSPGPQPGEVAHGHSSNADWEVAALTEESVMLTLAYPEDDPIERVTRIVTCLDDGLEFEGRIFARSAVDLPIGVHPTFRLPDRPYGATLRLPAGAFLASPPVQSEPLARVLPGSVFDDPAAAPAIDGAADVTELPWANANEDLLLVADVEDGRVELLNHDEGYRVTLTWDHRVARHLMLWISNYGRDAAPWSGRNRALGLEPITGAFDYGAAVSAAPNPLAARGAATTVHIEPGQEVVMRHRVTVGRL